MRREREITEIEYEDLYELVEGFMESLQEYSSDSHKKSCVNRMVNAFIRAGYYNRMDICEAKDITKKRGLGGLLAKKLILEIKGDYDERKAKEERLVEIDRMINALLNEKVTILKSLD